MNATIKYGGWVTNSPVATGGTFGLTFLIGCAAAVGAVLTSIGTGAELSLEQLQRATRNESYAIPLFEVVADERLPSPSENLSRIFEVLKPAVSDLAATVGVSRQSVYNWLKGEQVADESASKLRDLAQAAEVLADEQISVDAALLKRKFAKGRTLLQVSQAGESARAAALQLIQILKHETSQRERMSAKFANRAKTPATADFDLPAPNDLI